MAKVKDKKTTGAKAKGGLEIPGVVADYLLRMNDVLITMDEEVFLFDNGVYRDRGDILLKEQCKALAGWGSSANFWKEVLHHIRSSSHIERAELDADRNIVNLNNGLLDLTTRRLTAHTPSHTGTVRVPLTYDPDATCPKINRFLREVLSPDDVQVVLEFIGYTLYKDYPIHRWLLLTGGGRNGKSTLIRLIQAFVGQHNCSGCSLQVLSNRDFSLSDLYRKLANTCADLPTRGIGDTGLIKQLTGNDSIRGEYKYGKAFTFRNYAKLIFSANSLPKIQGDESMAFWSRLLLVNMTRTFTGEDDNHNLIDEITTPDELSGLLNLALDALANLLRRGDFSYDKQWENVAEDYKSKSDPVPQFVDECCEMFGDDWEATDDLFNGYLQYSQYLSTLPKSRVAFFRDLNAYCGTRIASYRRGGVAGYRGIRVIGDVGDKGVSSPSIVFPTTTLSQHSKCTPLSPLSPIRKANLNTKGGDYE